MVQENVPVFNKKCAPPLFAPWKKRVISKTGLFPSQHGTGVFVKTKLLKLRHGNKLMNTFSSLTLSGLGGGGNIAPLT